MDGRDRRLRMSRMRVASNQFLQLSIFSLLSLWSRKMEGLELFVGPLDQRVVLHLNLVKRDVLWAKTNYKIGEWKTSFLVEAEIGKLILFFATAKMLELLWNTVWQCDVDISRGILEDDIRYSRRGWPTERGITEKRGNIVESSALGSECLCVPGLTFLDRLILFVAFPKIRKIPFFVPVSCKAKKRVCGDVQFHLLIFGPKISHGPQKGPIIFR